MGPDSQTERNVHYTSRATCHVTQSVLVHVQVKAAHVAHVKLKTMRHPNVLKYVDGVEVRHYYCIHAQISLDVIV